MLLLSCFTKRKLLTTARLFAKRSKRRYLPICLLLVFKRGLAPKLSPKRKSRISRRMWQLNATEEIIQGKESYSNDTKKARKSWRLLVRWKWVSKPSYMSWSHEAMISIYLLYCCLPFTLYFLFHHLLCFISHLYLVVIIILIDGSTSPAIAACLSFGDPNKQSPKIKVILRVDFGLSTRKDWSSKMDRLQFFRKSIGLSLCN